MMCIELGLSNMDGGEMGGMGDIDGLVHMD